MCKTCHSLYDGGIISIDTNGLIVAKEVLEKYDSLIINKYIGSQFQKYSSDNAKFLEWHYTHVFLNIPYKK
jgi:predicted restriction endonuclease